MKASSIVTWSTLVLATTVACSGSDGSDDGTGVTTGGRSAASGGTGTATGGASAVGTGGAFSQTGGTGASLSFEGSDPTNPGDTTLTEDTTCDALELEPQAVEVQQDVTTTTETQVPAPVALYIMLDNTLSMDQAATGSSSSKWDEAVTALTSFMNDPASEGMDVAIQYFHPVGVDTSLDDCTGAGQAIPAVEMGPLPDNAIPLVDSLEHTGTDSSTPTTGALIGSIDYCAAFQAANPDENCVVVFVTDGLPHACGLSAQCSTQGGNQPGGFSTLSCVDPEAEAELTPIAAAGLANGVVSFMIGMAGVTEDGFTLLNSLAVAGGSDCTPDVAGDEACDVSTTGSDGLLAALAAIRESVTVVETVTETIVTTEMVPVPCEWTIPPSPEGEELDPNLVNVNLVDVNLVDAPPTPMAYVPTAVDCELATATGPAWYYDNPDAPTKILACPATCSAITTQTNMSVKVLFGCERPPAAY